MASSYNGWANHSTWNVALWIQNDEYTYNVAKTFRQYNHFIPWLEAFWGHQTPEGVHWTDPVIDFEALDALLTEP